MIPTTSTSESVEQKSVDRLSRFGHRLLKQFMLDPTYINLNNGSFGCLPHHVRIAYNDLSGELESSPDLFIRKQLKPRITEVRARLARLIGAETDECVMVPNVAQGVTTILRNFPWHEGDVIVSTNTAFHTIYRSVASLVDINPHPTVSQFILNFPCTHGTILSRFRDHLRSLRLSHGMDTTKPNAFRNVVVLFDSIVSMPGVIMPWREMVQICKEERAWSIVDAAHSLGQELDINLSAVDPDFWIANCNKWLFTKRGCAVMYVPKRNQRLIKYTLPPGIAGASPSNDGSVSPFVAEFHWSGSTDILTPLTVNAALDFRKSIGGEKQIIDYCHSLAVNGGQRLADMLQTEVMDSTDKPGELIPCMVNVRLPLSHNIKPSMEIARTFDCRLLEERKVYATNFYHNGQWWTRVSVQVFNEMSDFEKLGEALLSVCAELNGSLGQHKL